MQIDGSIQIKRLQEGDLNEFIDLILLFEEVFEMKNFSIPDSRHLKNFLGRNDFEAFVAVKNGSVVGGLTTYVLEQYYSKKPLAYIYDLAVGIKFQRQGIGKELIAETSRYYTGRGFEEVFVQADKVDGHAIDFYRKTNPTEEEQVVHFYYTLDK